MILTGNVMIDRKCRESSRNVVLNETNKDGLQPFQHWADHSMRSIQNPLVIVQLNHPGRAIIPAAFLSLVFSLDQKDHVEVQRVESVFQEFQGR